jgi:glutaminyl-peptide cyclotransferase
MRTRSFRKAVLAPMIWVLAVIATCSFVSVNAAVPEYTAKVVKRYPHDPNAFTEGLLYYKGVLYESTGRNGQSSIREVTLNTGKVVRQTDLDPAYYGEGIVIWKDRLIQLTWKNEIGLIYDLNTFKLRSNFHYDGEGWALTQDGTHLIMSDGTSDLRFLDPDTMSETGRIHVTCEGRPIRQINEIEWVKNQIYANIWQTNVIVRIDPATGAVIGLIDLTDLAASTVTRATENVPNGIAYDAAADRLFVTGKLWPALYQITLSPRRSERGLCQTLP